MRRIRLNRKRRRVRLEWKPRAGNRVYIATDPRQEPGTVKASGDEQSIVKWDAGYEQAELNRLLVHIGDDDD